MTANLRQGNEGKQLAQNCYAAMSGMAARDWLTVGVSVVWRTESREIQRSLLYGCNDTATRADGIGWSFKPRSLLRLVRITPSTKHFIRARDADATATTRRVKNSVWCRELRGGNGIYRLAVLQHRDDVDVDDCAPLWEANRKRNF